jgi:hypothetical protein
MFAFVQDDDDEAVKNIFWVLIEFRCLS